jgi:hypothetical protein
MKIAGETTPALSLMGEIPANTPIHLAPQTELTFLHYTECKLVNVAGGTLTLSGNGYSASDGGRILSERPGPCPTVHQVSGGGSSGGTVIRGVGAMPLPTRPDVAFVGSRAGKVIAASIAPEGGTAQPSAKLDVDNRHAAMPQAAPPLTANRRYVLNIVLSDPPSPLKIPVVARNGGETESLVVLRLD